MFLFSPLSVSSVSIKVAVWEFLDRPPVVKCSESYRYVVGDVRIKRKCL